MIRISPLPAVSMLRHALGGPWFPAHLYRKLRRARKVDRGPDGNLAFEAIVSPAAPVIEDLPPTEMRDNLVLAKGWDDDDIHVTIGPINSPPPGLPELGPGDRIVLHIGNYAFDPITLELANPGDPFSSLIPDLAQFHVATSLLGAPADYRNYAMFYEVFYTGGSDRGPDQRLSIDNVPPANTSFVGQMVFDDDRITTNGITPDVFLDDAGFTYIRARIPSYAGQKAGDIIRCYINGTVDPDDRDTGRVEWGNNGVVHIRISKAFIEAVGDGYWDFQYQIEGREGLFSEKSEPVKINVLLEEFIDDLAAPSVPAYDDDAAPKLVDEQDARDQLVVRLPTNPKVTTAHSVRILWGTSNSVIVPIDDPDDTVIIMSYQGIYADWLAKNGTGADTDVNVDVRYDIYKGDLRVGTSGSHRVVVNLHVAGGGGVGPGEDPRDNLTAPVVRPASGEVNDDTIPLDDSTQNASVRIPKRGVNDTEVFALGDRVIVHYGDTTLDPHTIVDGDLTDLDAPLSIVLPRAAIITGGPGLKDVSYWIERELNNGHTNISKSPVKTIRVETRDALPGKGFLDKAILPELNASFTIGLDALRDGTPVAFPEYEIFSPDDKIVVFAAMFLGRTPTPGETPVPGFGAEDTDADQDNRFEVPNPLVVLPADVGDVAEPGDYPGAKPTRPPVTTPHILFRIPRDRFPDVDANLSNQYHVFLRYEITNTVGPSISEVLTFIVDPRGAPPSEEETDPSRVARVSAVASALRSLMGTLRDLLGVINRSLS
jgi:hypothetical protein